MGVLNLWPILAPVQQHQTLSELKGQTLAVDLSIWVCETQCVKQMQGVVAKPFLRNLFFRICHLLQLGVHLVFAVEGDAPDLKKDTMYKRQQHRFTGKSQGHRGQGHGAGGRKNFNARLKECCRMLDYLGIPYLHSNGEAEALCAALDAAGLVDGCLTNDGDAFLYGARTVYRNFTMNSKDPHVERYKMEDVEDRLGLDRERMVAIALLLGCDYLPKGVPGVGVDKVIKLTNSLQGYSILDRFHKWRGMSEADCIDQTEVVVRRKALLLCDFPQVAVIEEFLISRDRCPSSIKRWKRPEICKLQEFSLEKLEWPVEYTLEKVLPLVTLWDMTSMTKHGQGLSLLQPIRIVKARTRQGVLCYEVEWHKPETDTLSPQDVYVTIETQQLFDQCFPGSVQQYETAMAAKKIKGKSSRKKKDKPEHSDETNSQDVEELSQAVCNLSLIADKQESQQTDPGAASLGTRPTGEEEFGYLESRPTDHGSVYLGSRRTGEEEFGYLESRPTDHGSVKGSQVRNKDIKTRYKDQHQPNDYLQEDFKNYHHEKMDDKENSPPDLCVPLLERLASRPKITVKGNVKGASLKNGHRQKPKEERNVTSGLLLQQDRNTSESTGMLSGNQSITTLQRKHQELETLCKMVDKDDSSQMITVSDDSDQDEEDTYIPLSQRVQMNLQKCPGLKSVVTGGKETEDPDVSQLCSMLISSSHFSPKGCVSGDMTEIVRKQSQTSSYDMKPIKLEEICTLVNPRRNECKQTAINGQPLHEDTVHFSGSLSVKSVLRLKQKKENIGERQHERPAETSDEPCDLGDNTALTKVGSVCDSMVTGQKKESTRERHHERPAETSDEPCDLGDNTALTIVGSVCDSMVTGQKKESTRERHHERPAETSDEPCDLGDNTALTKVGSVCDSMVTGQKKENTRERHHERPAETSDEPCDLGDNTALTKVGSVCDSMVTGQKKESTRERHHERPAEPSDQPCDLGDNTTLSGVDRIGVSMVTSSSCNAVQGGSAQALECTQTLTDSNVKGFPSSSMTSSCVSKEWLIGSSLVSKERERLTGSSLVGMERMDDVPAIHVDEMESSHSCCGITIEQNSAKDSQFKLNDSYENLTTLPLRVNLNGISGPFSYHSPLIERTPNCSGDLFDTTEFSHVDQIDFSILTPNLSHHRISGDSVTPGICESTPCTSRTLNTRNDHISCVISPFVLPISSPVLEKPTPLGKGRRVSFHRSTVKQKGFSDHYSIVDSDSFSSMNMTEGKSVLDFGNFQIESSLLRMDRGNESDASQKHNSSDIVDQSQNVSDIHQQSAISDVRNQPHISGLMCNQSQNILDSGNQWEGLSGFEYCGRGNRTASHHGTKVTPLSTVCDHASHPSVNVSNEDTSHFCVSPKEYSHHSNQSVWNRSSNENKMQNKGVPSKNEAQLCGREEKGFHENTLCNGSRNMLCISEGRRNSNTSLPVPDNCRQTPPCDVDRSPIALADRLRAKLQKDSQHALLRDFTGKLKSKHYMSGEPGSRNEKDRRAIVID